MPDQGAPERPEPAASCTPVLSFTPPMLASSGRPTGPLADWVVEPKADGWRAQVAVGRHGCAVWTRTGRDITAKVPEVAAIAELGVECVLDGELVAGAGLPADFYPLAGMLSARRRHQRSRSSPSTCCASRVAACSATTWPAAARCSSASFGYPMAR